MPGDEPFGKIGSRLEETCLPHTKKDVGMHLACPSTEYRGAGEIVGLLRGFDTASNLLAKFLLEDYHLWKGTSSEHIYLLGTLYMKYISHACRVNSAFQHVSTPYGVQVLLPKQVSLSCRLIHWPKMAWANDDASGKRPRLNGIVFPVTAAQW